jgi:hypothetical protein
MILMRTILKISTAVLLPILFVVALGSDALAQQKPAKTALSEQSGMSLRAVTSSARAGALLDPNSPEWNKSTPQRIALNRTPRLYDTEAPSELDISFVDIRLARAEGKLLVQMSWRDPTQDAAQIAKPPSAPTEGRPHKELTEATDRFFDSAAVMHPARLPENDVWPSLQMGDTGQPVSIYFWNAARGAAQMQAEGRGTTKRTGETFPAQAVYRGNSWLLSMELGDVPAGMPLAFAIWNGSQQDRDGRKYFTTWLRLE